MAFKWTEGDHVTSNIVDATEQNASFNNLKGEMNGGLDRENLPNESVSNDELHQSAFVKYAVRTGVRAQNTTTSDATWTDGVTPIAQKVRAINYNRYSGGWRTNTANTVQTLFQEGMLHIEFNCWYWLRNHFATQSFATRNGSKPIWAQFQVLVDGTPVCTTGMLWQNVGQVHAVADVPISTGQHEVSIRWRTAAWPGEAPSGAPVKASPVFYYDGGQITVINRYR